MKLAIISDLHADVHALRDALAEIERLGCDEIVCAGELARGGGGAYGYVVVTLH
jgi:predicted phosphodiesterase